jgi:hypothetical protein
MLIRQQRSVATLTFWRVNSNAENAVSPHDIVGRWCATLDPPLASPNEGFS